MNQKKSIVWQIHDHKPGHLNQMRGLTASLGELMPVQGFKVPAPSRWASWCELATVRFPAGDRLPAPDLILGAGHATHVAVLAARRACGGKAVVLMKPTLPRSLFDLCLVPRHDNVADSPNVVQTLGVLNNVIRSDHSHDSNQGLFLIGGPSSAHRWDDESMIGQIATIVEADPSISWKLTTSRRTPESFSKNLVARDLGNLTLVSHAKTSSTWVPDQLVSAGQVWVSSDSVSMVYESVTSGAAVGVLEVPCHRRGRVWAGIDELLSEGWATRYSAWQKHKALTPVQENLNEARRCAEIVSRRLLARKAA